MKIRLAAVAALTFLACAQAPAQHAGWWRLEEGAGLLANDTSANGNHGSISNATWTTGKLGGALQFNGTNALVTVPDSPSLAITGSIAVEAWVYPTGIPTQFSPVVTKWDDIGSNDRAYFLGLQRNNAGTAVYARFDVSHNGIFAAGPCFGAFPATNCASSSLVYSLAPLPLNTWTHLVGIFDSSTKEITIYVNGVANGSTTAQQNNIFDVRTDVQIGSGELGSDLPDYFIGKIDEPRIWNKSLDATYVGILFQLQQANLGTPGAKNCHGKTVSGLAQLHGGFAAAVTALGAPSEAYLQTVIRENCGAN